MNKIYLITEGQSDEDILKELLPEDAIANAKFVIGSGRYSAQSLARSILAVRHEPVALVLDADTTELAAIREQQAFLREALRQAAAGAPFGIFLAEPELEILFLESPEFLGNLSTRDFSPIELELARSSPRKFLHLISGEQDKKRLMRKLIKNIDERSLHVMRKHPLLANLTKFLSTISLPETDFDNGTDAYEPKSDTRSTELPR
jgi:hypothetical protein